MLLLATTPAAAPVASAQSSGEISILDCDQNIRLIKSLGDEKALSFEAEIKGEPEEKIRATLTRSDGTGSLAIESSPGKITFSDLEAGSWILCLEPSTAEIAAVIALQPAVAAVSGGSTSLGASAAASSSASASGVTAATAASSVSAGTLSSTSLVASSIGLTQPAALAGISVAAGGAAVATGSVSVDMFSPSPDLPLDEGDDWMPVSPFE
ncbi:MAG: hypothetical protein J5J00_14355 [Deltaproteobacteria bacterium]|nr:hypothetical protein [Deltaproteobacteria bacterium]